MRTARALPKRPQRRTTSCTARQRTTVLGSGRSWATNFGDGVLNPVRCILHPQHWEHPTRTGLEAKITVMDKQELFEHIVDSLHEAMFDESLWLPASALIDEALGSKGNHLVFSDQSWDEDLDIFFMRFCYRGEHHRALEREYFRTYYPVDDHLPGLRQLPHGKIAHVPETFLGRDLAKSVMYNEAMPRYGFRNGLNVRMDGPFDSRIIFGVADPIETDDWSSEQLDLVKSLLPHIRHFVRVRVALIGSGALATSLGQLLENARAGVIQIDRRGRIVAANDRAVALLRKGDVLSDEDGTLRASSPEDDAVLQGLVARALTPHGVTGAGGSMVVRRAMQATSMALHVTPVQSPANDFRTSRVAALVLAVDPGRHARIDRRVLTESLGLTPAESEVAALLAEGLSVSDIVERRGPSEYTVRWHVKQSLRKLGVSRQMDLVRVVQASGGVLPPGRRNE